MPDENELYERWRNTTGGERADVEAALFTAVKRHARAVVYEQLNETNPDLVHEIAKSAIQRLSSFRGQSKFSTWVQGIAKNKIKAEIRRRTRYRRVFNEWLWVDETEGDDDDPRGIGPLSVTPRPESAIAYQQLWKGLSPRERVLLSGMLDGKDQNQLAKELHMSPEAVQSARRRLRDKLRNTLGSRDG